MNDGMLNDVARAMAKNAIPAGLLAQAANQEEPPAEAQEAPVLAKPTGLSPRLRVALVAVAVEVLLPAIVRLMTADTGPSETVGGGALLVMVAAFVTGMTSSIAAIARRERFGWATLAAAILVPLVWFSILVLVAYLTSAVALP